MDSPNPPLSQNEKMTSKQLMISFTPVTYDYYNQWARSPRESDNPDEATVDSGQGASPESETSSDVPTKPVSNREPTYVQTKTFPRDALRSEQSERPSIARTTKPTCRSATIPGTDSYSLPPLSVKRAATVMGYEKILKKVPADNTLLPMNQAVFLFKGDVFVQNSDYLTEPYKVSNYPGDVPLNSRYYNPRNRPECMGYGINGGITRARNAKSAQIPKVQFIDFTEIKSYMDARNKLLNEIKAESKKEKHFVPLNFQMKLNSV